MLTTAIVFAQKGEIKAFITGKYSGERIPFALVSVFDQRFEKTVNVTVSNESRFFTNMVLNYNPAKLKGWQFSARMLDMLSTNIEALNTWAYNAAGKQIFYQEVEYDRFGTIVGFGAAYSLNTNGKSRKKADSTFGKEQF